MDNEIICHVDMFGESLIQFPNGDSTNVPNEYTVNALLAGCSQYSLHKIHLLGPTSYVNGLVEMLKEQCPEKYSNLNLEIEVN